MNTPSTCFLRIRALFRIPGADSAVLSRTRALTAVYRRLSCSQPVRIDHTSFMSTNCNGVEPNARIPCSTYITNRWYSNNGTTPADQEPGKKERFENILTIPNFLTVSRMAMCPLLGYLVIQQSYWPAFGLFVVAGITDLVTLI